MKSDIPIPNSSFQLMANLASSRSPANPILNYFETIHHYLQIIIFQYVFPRDEDFKRKQPQYDFHTLRFTSTNA